MAQVILRFDKKEAADAFAAWMESGEGLKCFLESSIVTQVSSQDIPDYVEGVDYDTSKHQYTNTIYLK